MHEGSFVFICLGEEISTPNKRVIAAPMVFYELVSKAIK